MKNEPLSLYRLETLTRFLSKKPVIKQAFYDRFNLSATADDASGITALNIDSLNNTTIFFNALLFLKQKNLAHIAFQAGLEIEMGSLGILDFYLLSCENVQEVLATIVKYFPLISADLDSKLDAKICSQKKGGEHNNSNCFSFRIVNFDATDSKQQLEIEFIFGLLINLLNRITRQELRVQLNLADHSLASSSYQLLSQNNIKVKLKSDQYELILNDIQLSQRLPFASKMSKKVLVPELEQQLKNLKSQDTIISQILYLCDHCHQPPLSQLQVAENLNMSESSLKRKLAENHTTFTALISSYKKETALKFLSNTHLSYDDIALKTGYSDRASFERAFKKWIGMTPSQFRQLSSFSQINTRPISLEDIQAIPPSPKVCQQVISMTQTDDFNMTRLADLIRTDPVLTGKLIGVANSAFYGGQQISDLEQAIIRVLGISMVQNLTISMMCCQQLNTSECSAFDLTRFWVESLATAEVSKHFANSPRIKDIISPSELYLASLLHAIGVLALAHLRPQATQQYLQKLHTMGSIDGTDFSTFENKIFGHSFSEIGALILTHWGLPQKVCQTVRQLEQEQGSQASKLINLLTKMVNLLQYHPESLIDNQLADELMICSGLSANQLENILVKITAKLPEVNELATTLAQ